MAAAHGMGHKVEQPLKEDKKIKVESAKGSGSIHILVMNLNNGASLNEVIISHILPLMPRNKSVAEFWLNICQSVGVSYVYSCKYGG